MVLRKITDTGQQQQLSDVGKRSGWAAVGVVVDYVAMREVRVKNIAGIGGEIGDEMSALYRDSIRDSWQILFGNFDTEVYDVTKLIYGFNLYHKVKLSAELQKLYGIESAQMNSNCIPPGMRKVAVAGQLSSKSSKTQKLHSSPAHLEVSEECTRLSGSKGQNYDIFSSDDIISKGVSLNSVLLNNNTVKSSTSFRSGQSVDKHSTASVSTTSHITSSKPQCRICGSYQNSSSGLGSLDSELSIPTVENPFVTEDGNYFCGTCLKATLSLSLSGKTFCDLHSIHDAGERQMEERIDTGGSSQGDVLSSKRIRDEDASNTG